jgi:hypothetical protein
MSKLKDLIGKKFGNLLVIERIENKQYKNQSHVMYRCLCDCGRYINVEGQKLRSGVTTHCGCNYKQIIDLVGQRFGRLVVIKKERNKNGLKNRSQKWLCQCDCGNTIITISASLKNGCTQSCGCLQKEISSKNGKKNLGIKRPDTSIGYGMANFNALYGKYKRRALNRSLIFELTPDEFKDLTQRPCYYCGCDPIQSSHHKGFNGKYIYNGIDRIDTLKGYTLDNVVPSCGKCNKMKWDLTTEDFFDHIKKIYENHIIDED